MDDIKKLGLPLNWENKIKNIIHENRMEYEPWVEAASSYNELRDSLRSRGYTNLPINLRTLLDLTTVEQRPQADLRHFKEIKTMLRKKS